MTYSVSGEAAQEISDAVAFYKDHAGPAVAKAFLDEFVRVARLVDTSPGLGTPTVGGRRFFPLRRFPYSIIYRPGAGGVRIVVVAHQHRRPGYWRGRT